MAGIQALALHPAHTNPETFRALLEASEGLARARGKQWLAAPVYGRHTWALRHMLAWGYRVDYAMVRMVLEGMGAECHTDGYVNLSAWAG